MTCEPTHSDDIRAELSLRKLARRTFLQTTAGLAGAALLTGVPLASGSAEAATTATARPASPGQPKRGGTLIYAVDALGENNDPGIFVAFGNWMAIDCMCEGLTSFDYKSPASVAQPRLAERWEISSDRRAYTFSIRKGVKFHDGTSLDAYAVKRNWTRLLDPTDPTRAPGTYAGSEIGGTNIKEIRTPDAQTVQLVLYQPDEAQLLRLATPNGVVLSPAAIKKYGKDVGKNLVATGPFKFDSMISGQNVTMSAFDGYWGGRPYLDRLILKPIGDESTLISSMLSGETDITNFAPITALKQFQGDPNLNVQLGAPWIVLFLALNAKIGVTKNKLVRQAINYAIDRRAIRDGVFSGATILPAGMNTPADWAYDPALQSESTQNIAKAKSLLAQAGYPNGVTISMDLVNSLFYPRLAESVQNSAAAAGVKIIINKLDEGTFSGKIVGGKSQASLTQRSGFVADPDNKLTPLLYSTTTNAQVQTGNDIYPNAKQFDHMLDQARAEPNQAKRRQMYFQIEALLLDTVPYVYLAYLRLPVVMQTYVMGVNSAALGTYRLYPHDIWLNK